MIKSFKCKQTERLFNRERPKSIPNSVHKVGLRKLDMIDAAERLDDLKIPPKNRLEALKGKRKGQHSIRINSQWRVCFVWRAGHAYSVEIVDYHR